MTRHAATTIIALCLCIGIATYGASPRRTTGPAKTARSIDVKSEEPRLDVDTLYGAEAAAHLAIYNYDKPLRSRYQTMIVSNESATTPILSAAFTIHYIDGAGQTFHTQTYPLNLTLEPKESRHLRLHSWDVQYSYYYVASKRAKNSRGIPYTVSISIDRVLLAK